jgi:tetratricopeptide (TPR) repeat protein
MKILKYILLLIIILSLAKDFQCFAQNYADKAYYLVDSLDLDALKKDDKKLIETSLKAYHKVKEDTSKVEAIEFLVEECLDYNVWPKYNRWVYDFVKLKIADRLSSPILQSLNESLANALNNIGYLFMNQGDILKALEYYHKSLTIHKEIGDKSGIANSLNNIGGIYHSQGDIPKALEYFHKSLTIEEEIGSKEGIASSLNNIGALEIEQGALALAEKHLQRSLKLAREVGSPKWMSSSSSSLSKLAKMQGKYKLAMQMFERHIQMRDSINNEATQKASAQQEAKYAYEKQKTIDNAEHNKFTYTAAQNPIWIIRQGEIIEIKPEKMPIGKHENDTAPFIGGEFETQNGDVIYTITDGFHDQFGGEKGKKFKPFKNYLISIAHLPMQEQKEKLTEKFTTWKGDEEQVDDVCIIGVKV